MRTLSLSIIAALALSVAGLATAFAGSYSNATTVATARTGLGRIIVDGHGRTLYLFEKDRRGHSACSGACAVVWQPLLARSKPMATAGRETIASRPDPTHKRTQAGHLRRPPALP